MSLQLEGVKPCDCHRHRWTQTQLPQAQQPITAVTASSKGPLEALSHQTTVIHAQVMEGIWALLP